MRNITQYEYLDVDQLLAGVVEWMVNEDPLLNILPSKPITGNSYKYNVELTLPTASWSASGQPITSSSGEVSQRTTDIYTLIQNCLTDKGAIAQNSMQDPEQVDIQAGAKAMTHAFSQAAILGQTSLLSTSLQFKGLLRILAEMESATTTDLDGLNNSQVVVAAADSGAVTMPLLDELIDKVKPGKPDLLLCSKRAHRKINALQRASGGGVIMVDYKDFGLKMPSYNGIPILDSDYIPDNFADGASSVLAIASYDASVTRASGYDNTTIFALKLGEQDVTGLNSGQMTHERHEFSEGFNAVTNRFVWYCGLAVFKKHSIAALINVNPDS